jgi:hypothetical protein
MTALSVTASQVAWVSGPIEKDQPAGEAFNAGACVYFSGSAWLKAQCDGTAAEAGAEKLGIALATADGVGARLSIAVDDAVVTLGAGAAPAAGTLYAPGRTAGSLVPMADLASTDKVTPFALGIGSNKVQLKRNYNVGAAL